jgi:hypothetical protein
LLEGFVIGVTIRGTGILMENASFSFSMLLLLLLLLLEMHALF